jgi:transglutaminase-like putative cysteine protease
MISAFMANVYPAETTPNHNGRMENRVGCALAFDVTEPAELVLQVGAGGTFTATLDGVPVDCARVGGQRVVHAARGDLRIRYDAVVPRGPAPEVTAADRIVALRPSRYCPSDRLAGFAGRRFGTVDDDAERARAVRAFVHEHLTYTAASSGPQTDAVDTLLSAEGVCRDYAHLTVALCRAVNVPARVASVYAPGLSPMDFHLVAETLVAGGWHVWDATGLAPRGSLSRIATGRDAADVAFATTITGVTELRELEITAVVQGDLPVDDHASLVSLPAG